MTSLILLRHAKAVPGGSGGDHQRELAAKGRDGAALIGAELKRLGVKPDIVLVSSALRTRETYDIVAATAGFAPGQIEDDIYLASATVLMRRLRKIVPRTKCVMLVGHNPGIAELADHLSDPAESDAAALKRLRLRFPPAACAVMSVLTPWSELQDGDCALQHYITPHDLGGSDED